MKTFEKDAQGRDVIDKKVGDEKPYVFDWTDRIGSMDISSHEVTVIGVEKVSDQSSGKKVTVTIKGGTVNRVCSATCKIVAGPDTFYETMYFNIIPN